MLINNYCNWLHYFFPQKSLLDNSLEDLISLFYQRERERERERELTVVSKCQFPASCVYQANNELSFAKNHWLLAYTILTKKIFALLSVLLPLWVECSPMVRKTWDQSQVASYQRLSKWYLIPPCLTLSNIRYVSRERM